ncbi:hypothetical protein Pmar_PMAR026559 [Perkinsus marinus ATCC 50983]|uniref:Uncharacterized protein n=1 Tax=Perkinsus marinus (strain ATCC 50983 / TXsc) TaxID=423536 RepID=C5LDW1_PERM5|nr:hypothetical protein Pmar_PMAR026559 [Perkinsus marinus ATCC 50983]EER05125.1 hypothetical protein Pmar_PMAR026559 [Perkinsus marinus ATCC 50983]|eukprot:XP_002773309.1 hypothetical protein Pmar_PMAR026559 [Perkinsus marinus ATCC 50983]
MGFLRRRANKVNAAEAVPMETLPTSASQAKADLEKEARKKNTLLGGQHPLLAHNTYFLDEDLDMGADIDNLDNVPGSGIQETTEKEESAYHYYDPLSGNTRLATSGGTDNGETWQWGKVDNVLKHSLKERTHPGSYKGGNYDGDARLTTARFEDSGDFDRNMFKSEEAPKEWMAAADDGDIFAHQSKEVKAGAK